MTDQQNAGGQTNTDTTGENVNGQPVAEPTTPPAGDTLMTNTADNQPQGDGNGDNGSQTQDATKAPEEPPAEINYEFELPEGFALDEATSTELIAFAKEKNLSVEEGQKLVDLGVAMRQREAEQYQVTQKQWVDSIKADPEMGGAQLNENIAVAKKALDAFGTPELTQLLDTTGFGNHPEVVRAFYKIGKSISEDRLVIGQGKPRGVSADPAKRMFPNQN